MSRVVISDTFIPGAEWPTIPSIDHKISVILCDTIFSYMLVLFLKRT